ncbi:alpha/beta hydrolase fold domain-containing protein [Arthrobacter sp. B2a2-09]
METKTGIDPFFTKEGMAHTGDFYLDGQDPHQKLLAPAALADMTGFPPLLLQVGTNELLLDDSVRLAERARHAEVDVILDVTAGVPHVFQSFKLACNAPRTQYCLPMIKSLVVRTQATGRQAIVWAQVD